MAADVRIFQVEAQSFQQDVVEKSKNVPVVLLFWTDQVPASADTKRVLERLADQYQGKFVLAHSDIARDPAIAQQLRVQSLPSVRLVRDGQIQDQLDGPQGERSLRDFLDKHTMSSSEKLKGTLAEFIAREDWNGAVSVLQQALNEEPNNPQYMIEWADVLIRKGDLDGARDVLAAVPEGTVERSRPETRLAMAEEARKLGTLKRAAKCVQENGTDLEARYRYSVLLAHAGQYEQALEQALVILQTDRSFNNDVGRETMVRIMSLLEKDSPVAKIFRRRMFSFMH